MKIPVRIQKIKRYLKMKKEATSLMINGDIKSYFQKLYEIEALKVDLARTSNDQRRFTR